MKPSPPWLLTESDELGIFDCGNLQLNNWLINQAWRNQKNNDSRTYISVDSENGNVVGFYSLAARSVARGELKGRLARNAPNPVPVILLGQLAVSLEAKGTGLGASLFVDAVKRSQAAAELIGARAIITEAIDDNAISFYEHLGMVPVETIPNTLYLLLR